MYWQWEVFAFVATQLLIIIGGYVIWRVSNNPEIKRIKQQIEDKKKQIENNKNMLVQVCCSKLNNEQKQSMIEYHTAELNKLKQEIIELNNKLPKRQQEAIKLNVSEILDAVNKMKGHK